MQPQEKKIILKEIEKWRQSRLLPREYCDFLMNLYLEGEQTAAQVSASNSQTVANRLTVKQGFRIFLLALLFTVCFGLIIEFHTFSFATQAILIANVIAALLIFTIFIRKVLLRFLSLVSMALLFLVEAYILDRAFNFPLHSFNGTGLFLLAFCLWTVIGTLGRSKWIAGLGLIMAVLFCNWLIVRYIHTSTPYLYQHMFAIGIACILGFWARVQLYWKVKTSIVWVFATAFSFFLPDINQWMNGQPLVFEWEGILFLKILLLTSMGIVWRNRLQSWWNL